jgi:Ankyrin repeats (many copies)
MVQLLLEHGADVDPQDNNNATPLHLAPYKGTLRPHRCSSSVGLMSVHEKMRVRHHFTSQHSEGIQPSYSYYWNTAQMWIHRITATRLLCA